MRQISILLWIALSLAGARLGWVFLVRHDARLRMEDTSQARRERTYQVPRDDSHGGVGITQFYARSGEMTAGDPNLICYGVRNARSVRIEPPVESLTPAMNRCFFVEPNQDTTYTLVAEGTDGSQASESFRVRVKPAPPAILMFTTSERQIPKGEAVTLCYGVAHAGTVRMEPDGWQLPPLAKNCVRFYPKATATFTLIASGDGGTDRKAFSVTVR
jgi:hypothetical protein